MKTVVHVAWLALVAAGCVSSSQPPPLRSGAFTGSKPTIPTDPGSAVDRSGVLPAEGMDVQGGTARAPVKQAAGAPNGDQRVSSVVQENVRAPSEAGGFNLTSTAPVLPRFTTGPSSGQYVTVGGVVAEVNSTPIYADKVVAQIAPILAARARELPPTQFKMMASKEIHDQIEALMNLELEYANAAKNLDSKDKDYAELLTADWRRHKIAEAVSEELARKRAEEQGLNFDEVVAEQYRVFLSQIYYQKKLVPRIQVTAEDMRRYYERHVMDEFTQRETVRFRLIKITVKQVGDKELARQKIEALRKRIIDNGEDFASIATTTNDPALLNSGGEMTIQKGAFGVEKVEQAAWATPVGGVTEIIDTPDAFYIAKVEEKTPGRTAAFDEEQVQQSIRHKLWSEQFQQLRNRELELRRKEAMIRADAEMMMIAVNMALENYPMWAQKNVR